MNFYDSVEYQAQSPSVIALGCFDGVHIGHRAVIEHARKIADETALPLTVWCFEEPPKNFFIPSSVPLITDKNEKKHLMSELGIDTLVCVPFNKDIANMSATDFFCEILLNRLKAAHIVCGFNFTFGKNGSGNTALLSTLCEEYGVKASALEPITLDGITVSSSLIRRAISDGDTALCNQLLQRPYSLTSRVISGKQLARRLGFPTANQLFPDGKAIPKYGVYLVRATVGGEVYKGISNIGMRPTVNETELCIETHLLDFSGDIYGEELTVELLKFIRPEQKFSSVEALKTQIEKDLASINKRIPR